MLLEIFVMLKIEMFCVDFKNLVVMIKPNLSLLKYDCGCNFSSPALSNKILFSCFVFFNRQDH